MSEKKQIIKNLEEEYDIVNLEMWMKRYQEKFSGKNPLYGSELTQDFKKFLEDSSILENASEKKRIQFSISNSLYAKIKEYSEDINKKKSPILSELLNWYFSLVTIFKNNDLPFSVRHITKYCQNLLEDDMNLLITKPEFIKYTTDSFTAIINGFKQVFSQIKEPTDDNELDQEIFELQEENIMKNIQAYYNDTIALWGKKKVDIKESSYDILVLDDDVNYHERLQSYFSSNRTIKCVKNFIEFVIFLKKERPKIILIDILLPGKRKGYEICQLLKSKSIYKNIPIILISASNIDDINVLKDKYKADAFYQKKEVYDLKKLNRLINNYII